MKRLLLSAVLLLGGISTSFGQYCTTGGPSSTGDSNLGSADLVGVSTSVSYVGCPGVTGVEDQTALSADLIQGEAYSIDIEWGTCGGSYGNAGTAWIDWDGSLTFDVGEEIATWTGSGGSGVMNYPFTVPAGAVLGATRMRISQFEGGSLPLDPCGTTTWGSVTDFGITVFCPGTLTAPTVIGSATCLNNSAMLTGTSAYGTINWYDAPGGTLLGTGTTYTTPVLTASTDYYATVTLAVCPGESVEAIASVAITAVDVALTLIDETCAGNADGSFAIGAVTCGSAPFTYSLDGGTTFGPASTDLAPGMYSVIVRDMNGDDSAPIDIVIGTQSSVAPNAPTLVQSLYQYCSGTLSMPIEAIAPTATCANTASANGTDNSGVTASVTDFSCATGTIVSATLDATIGSFCGSWYDYNIVVNGTQIATGQCNQTGFDLTPYLPLTSVEIVSTDLDFIGDNVTLNLTVNLTYENGSILWFDGMPGTQIGTGSPFETVGTSVLPDPNVLGTYDFYVGATNGCYSDTLLVQVNISDVLVDLTPQDETCTSYSNGTFAISNVSCGTAPFTFSVDGGAFGPAPTNLAPGNYSVVVQDDGMLQSAPVAITIATTDTIIPPDPIAVDSAVYACVGDLSIMVDATSTNIEWFDATTAGNSVGAGSPFETVGTTILPDANTAGTYPFYAAGFGTGCYSTGRTLINVYVTTVNVELAAIDADCNNAATGSFSIADTLCGQAPFTFAVDGGAFGPTPTDLMPGAHSIIVQDNNMEVSAAYTLVIDEAAAPSGLVMTTITDDGGQVSWDSNGSETEWYVEWGLPGFIPGSGAEIGSANPTDTFNIITGLDANTNYDVYVAANCGPTEVIGEWVMINFTTNCGIYNTPFFETFEDNSETRVCWYNIQEVGTEDWTYETGAGGGAVTTAFEGTMNARFVSTSGTADPVSKLVSPRFDFTGQDSVALVFAYAQEAWFGDQNTLNVFVNGATSPFVSLMNYTLDINAWTVDTLFLADTTFEVAFEGTNNFGRANVIDYVQFLPCNLVAGTDGAADVCRADSTVDLNTIITKGEYFGKWSFPINETFIENDSIANFYLLPAGVYEFLYIVETPCASDTTIAEVTVYGPSSAGIDGTISVCQNQPVDLLSGLSGNVDLGGQWYDPSNSPTPSAITASFIPGLFNYDYITSNGVCEADTANVVVDVNATCDYLNIQEIVFGEMEVYPNPTTGVVYISNGNTEVFSFEITDVKGKVVASKSSAINGTETTEINLGNLEVGIYMIKVYNETASKTFRVVKQ